MIQALALIWSDASPAERLAAGAALAVLGTLVALSLAALLVPRREPRGGELPGAESKGGRP